MLQTLKECLSPRSSELPPQTPNLERGTTSAVLGWLESVGVGRKDSVTSVEAVVEGVQTGLLLCDLATILSSLRGRPCKVFGIFRTPRTLAACHGNIKKVGRNKGFAGMRT